ncbi:hypothetical protein [Pseudomonas paraversuta]|uniref:hypothetical protein n=1 Tax=Pseudomonas paraversuta TaxID=2750624 RepID=UPI001923D7F3|nr:hypothetical protein [Pseudomonas paraversuta]
MDWYESLFLQMCAHVLSEARMSDTARVSGKPNYDITATRRIVGSYRKEAQLAYDAPAALEKISSGAKYVVLILVREHQFINALQNLKEKCHVVLSATMETDARASAVSNYYVDVAICKPF